MSKNEVLSLIVVVLRSAANAIAGLVTSPEQEHERDGTYLDWGDEDKEKEELLGAPPKNPCGCGPAQPGFLETTTPGFLPDTPAPSAANDYTPVCEDCGYPEAECNCDYECFFCGSTYCDGECQEH